MDTFKFPMRFLNGQVEKFVDGSDDFYAHLLAMSMQILPGELPLNPDFGVEDPAFEDSLTRDLAFTAGAFIPEIIIDSAEVELLGNGQVRANIAFSQRNE
jgi:hypothetical protein